MKQRVIGILKNFGIEESAISDNANFIKDLGFDSLDTVDLMMQLEQEFNINIPDDDYPKIATIQNLLSYLEENQTVAA
ncbi:Acyl carrier protein [Dyadobacter sp. CECT 9275]|uniref:Acyl carrier protein n=1 Tax=Dyadobacter helix TaxID=2822344 RepID=A0A916JEE8_9BACT|nr:acyl carrier protein [Dyadobacter sp. CECT 9275]CAG5007109.1 Acyl carrier protein [Dyadobacter sp. CECT 9275]